MLTRASTMAPSKAEPKLVITKPGTKLEATQSINALITHQKTPSVTTVSGNVRILSRSPSVALTSPMTSTAKSAEPRPLTWKPGTICETSQSASALRSQLRSVRMRLCPCVAYHVRGDAAPGRLELVVLVQTRIVAWKKLGRVHVAPTPPSRCHRTCVP